MKYISMKMDPKGSTPPTATITQGSMNHFFSGIGLGTALILGWRHTISLKVLLSQELGAVYPPPVLPSFYQSIEIETSSII